MNIPYDFNPIGKTKKSGVETKTATIWKITTPGANTKYGIGISDYSGETNIIDWGDGTSTITSSKTSNTAYSHTYAAADTYKISVIGQHTNIRIANANSTYGKYVSEFIQVCDSVTNCSYMFNYCNALTSLPDGFTIPNNVTNCSYMFGNCSALTSLPDGFTIPNSVTNCQYMFYNCSNFTSLPEGFTIPNSVTKCSYMFAGCLRYFTSLPDGFTIPNSVTNCSYMFNSCQNLTSLPEGFTIPNSVTKCSYMFDFCRALTSLPDGFTIPNSVTHCQYMFDYCGVLTSLPDGFTIPNSVANCSYMFSSCQNLTSLPEGFTIPNSVIDCSAMFTDCLNLVYDISILLSKWTAKTRRVNYCFNNCKKLIGQAPANVLWNVQSITNYSRCFTNCTSLSNYYSIPYTWGGGAVQMADQNFLVIDSNQEIQLVADGGGTLTFTSENLPEGVSLSSDGKLTGFSVDGTYTINVKCSSSYGTEASAVITVKVDLSLIETQNNLTSDQSNQNFYVSQRTTSGSYNAWKAMDGNKSTYSRTQYASGQTDWWQIEFVSPVILSQIYLKMDNQSSTKSYLQASNDGSNWVNLMTSTIADPFDDIIQLNLETPYKYYRFLADRTNYYIQIYEVVFYYKI